MHIGRCLSIGTSHGHCHVVVVVLHSVRVDEIHGSYLLNRHLEGSLPRLILREEEGGVIFTLCDDGQLMTLLVCQLIKALLLSGESPQCASIRVSWPSMNQGLNR